MTRAALARRGHAGKHEWPRELPPARPSAEWLVDSLTRLGVVQLGDPVLDTVVYMNSGDARAHHTWLCRRDCVCLSGHVHDPSTTGVYDPDGGYVAVTGGALYTGYEGIRGYNWGRRRPGDGEVTLALRKMAGERYAADADRHDAAPEGVVTLPRPAPGGEPAPPSARPSAPPELRFLRDEVELAYEAGWYDARFTKLVANDSLDEQDSIYARILVDAFPDDREHSVAHHRAHRLSLDEIGFEATADVRDIEVDVLRDEDANKELMLRFYRDGEPAPLVPGERVEVLHLPHIGEAVGPFIERNVRVPTERLVCRLRCRPEEVVQVSAIENPHLLQRNTVHDGPRARAEGDCDVYEWEVLNPPRNSRHRLVWSFAEPPTVGS